MLTQLVVRNPQPDGVLPVRQVLFAFLETDPTVPGVYWHGSYGIFEKKSSPGPGISEE